MLANLTLSPKVAGFSGHSGEYIIQGERNGGCRGWILGEQQALQASLCMYLWDTSWGGSSSCGPNSWGHLLVTCRHPALHCSMAPEDVRGGVWPMTGVTHYWCGSNYYSHTLFGSHSWGLDWTTSFSASAFPCTQSYRNILLK